MLRRIEWWYFHVFSIDRWKVIRILRFRDIYEYLIIYRCYKYVMTTIRRVSSWRIQWAVFRLSTITGWCDIIGLNRRSLTGLYRSLWSGTAVRPVFSEDRSCEDRVGLSRTVDHLYLEPNNYKKRLLKAPSASSLKCYRIVINQGTWYFIWIY